MFLLFFMLSPDCLFFRFAGSEGFRYIQHFRFPIVTERIDGDDFGSGLLCDGFCIAFVEFRLYEDDLYIFFFTQIYQSFQVGG